MNEFQKHYQTTLDEQVLRWEYGQGKITLATFKRRYEKLKRKGLIRRSGKVLK